MQIPKSIIATAKLLETISPKLATMFAAKLFSTPIKHKIPTRELQMVSQSEKQKIYVPKIKKEIQIYRFGNGEKKALLVHGWSGRGTQLFKIADELVINGYHTISFDAPAHGKSQGKTTLMTEFITSIHEIDKTFGPFDIAVGHSLGGMSILNAINQNFNTKKAVIIGSGDIIQNIIDDFILRLQLKPKIAIRLKEYLEKLTNEKMDNYSSYIVAKNIDIPVLIIHDKNDIEVPVKAALNIHKYLKNSILIITEGLGHRKIIGDKEIIKYITEFIN